MHNYINLLPEFVRSPSSSLYDSKNFVVVDFETTNLDKGDPVNPANRLVLSVWSYRGKLKWSWGSEFEQEELLSDCESADFIIAHNAKFECGWLQRCGLDLTKTVVFCTQIAEYVILSNRKLNRLTELSLDKCCSRYGVPNKNKLVSLMIKGGVCPSEIPRKWLLKYGKIDVLSCLDIFKLQLKRLKKTGQLNVLYTRCLTIPCLADIEFNGMCVDSKRLAQVYGIKHEQHENITSDLHELIGERNPRSSQQMAEFLYEELGFDQLRDSKGNPITTGTKKPKTDSDTIARLKPRTEEQKRFLSTKLRFSEIDAELTKALNKLKALCEAKPILPLIFANFNLSTTNTLRLSSTGKSPYNIQLQNIARTHKPFFRARNPDWCIGEADERQLEFRSAGELSKDERILEDIRTGVDVHAVTAATITAAGQPIERGPAKSRTFKPLYGGESGTRAEKEYYKLFKQKYSGHTALQEQWISEAINTGKLTTPTGHVFYFGGTSKSPVRISRSGYVENNQKVKNYPIQYFAGAEVVLMGLVCAWHIMKALNTLMFIICTVHDSIIAELPEEERELFEDIMDYALVHFPKYYMQKHYVIEMQVPLEAEITISSHWNDSDEWREQYKIAS